MTGNQTVELLVLIYNTVLCPCDNQNYELFQTSKNDQEMVFWVHLIPFSICTGFSILCRQFYLLVSLLHSTKDSPFQVCTPTSLVFNVLVDFCEDLQVWVLLQHPQNFSQLKVPEDSASTTPVTSLHHHFPVCTKDNLVISL